MAIKKTRGMTLAQFCKENDATQITVQHSENERITHIAGFVNAANYELLEAQTIWFRVGSTLIEKVYKKPSVIKKVIERIKTTGLKGKRK